MANSMYSLITESNTAGKNSKPHPTAHDPALEEARAAFLRLLYATFEVKIEVLLDGSFSKSYADATLKKLGDRAIPYIKAYEERKAEERRQAYSKNPERYNTYGSLEEARSAFLRILYATFEAKFEVLLDGKYLSLSYVDATLKKLGDRAIPYIKAYEIRKAEERRRSYSKSPAVYKASIPVQKARIKLIEDYEYVDSADIYNLDFSDLDDDRIDALRDKYGYEIDDLIEQQKFLDSADIYDLDFDELDEEKVDVLRSKYGDEIDDLIEEHEGDSDSSSLYDDYGTHRSDIELFGHEDPVSFYDAFGYYPDEF